MLVYQRVLEMAMIPDMKGHQRFEWVWYLKKGVPEYLIRVRNDHVLHAHVHLGC